MRNGKALLIASRGFAQEIRWKSWWCLLSTAFCWLGTAAAMFWLPWQWCLPLSVISGLLMVRMFVIYHDFMHGAILRRSRVGQAILHLFGYAALSPPKYWKHSHDDHHHNNCRTFGAALGSFPLLTIEQYREASLLERLSYKVVRHPITIAAGYATGFVWYMSLSPLLRNPRENYYCALALVIHAAIYVGLAFVSWKILCFGWILPLWLAGALGTYLFYVQHNFPGIHRMAKGRWDYVRAALQSSSYVRMNPLMHWFTGNIGFHHVHHLNHKIPFYRLPETMSKIPELQKPHTVTLWPADVVRCLRLKLWDSAGDRLVTFRQARLISSA